MPPPSRGVAQPGSASHWGCGGRWFESSRPDHHYDRRPGTVVMQLSLHGKVVSPKCPTNRCLMMMQAAPAGQSGGTVAALIQMFPLLAIFVIFYLLVMRPQQRRVKEHQERDRRGEEGRRGRHRRRHSRQGDQGRRRRGGGRDRAGREGPGRQVDDQPGASTERASRPTTDARISAAGRCGWSRSSSRSGVLLSIPSLLAGTPYANAWPKWLPQYRINLGLDLAGGSHLLLEADAE